MNDRRRGVGRTVTLPREAGASECHETDRTAFSGHWRCSCGYVGTDSMMAVHMADVGWCPDCWGAGSDEYPSLGICRTCGGSGEMDDVRRLDLDQATARARRRIS